MNSIDKQYQELLRDILQNGVSKEDRTGTGTVSVFGRQIRHKMSEGFPLLTTKKMPFKSIVTELIWFLRGGTNIRYLVDNGCNIWNGDAYKNYCKIAGAYEEPDYDVHIEDLEENKVRLMTLPEFVERVKTDSNFARVWGDLGPIYGQQWRDWSVASVMKDDGDWEVGVDVDQIQNLIDDLKTNPDSRRLMVSAWNVGELDQMVLPPCHYGFQVYTRELSLSKRGSLFNKMYPDKSVDDFKEGGMEIQSLTHQLSTRYDNAGIPSRAISLMWNQRSVDTFLGLPFNIASYALLLEIIAKEVNMIPDELIGNLGDVHLYSNHLAQAIEQESRTSFYLPRLTYLDEYNYLTDKEISGEIPFTKKVNKFRPDFFKLENYESHPTIQAPLSN